MVHTFILCLELQSFGDLDHLRFMVADIIQQQWLRIQIVLDSKTR